jgi:hypothetical protein
LAPDKPLHHAWALALIGLAFSTGGAFTMWNFGPHCYSLAVIAMNPLCAWAGGRLGGQPALA